MSLAHPIPGYEITTPYGGYPGHRGADFASPTGTPILAAHDGVVRFAGWDDRGGWMVYLTATDGRSETSYQHMNTRPSVKHGQRVNVGDVLGHVGTTGMSTGPHLHFEYWVNGKAWQGGTAVDPAPYIGTPPEPPKPIKKDEDIMAIYLRPVDNSTPVDINGQKLSRIWAGDNREINGAIYSGTWERSDDGSIRRLFQTEWDALKAAYAAADRKVPVSETNGNTIEQMFLVTRDAPK